MRQWTGGPVDNFQQVEQAWAKGQPVIGRTVLPKASLGLNPFGEQQQTICKMEGTLRVPADAEYGFAMSADDRAALYVDGKPVLFAASAPGDARINAKAMLKRGKQPIVFYHVNTSGDMRFVAAWNRAGDKGYDMIDAAALGQVYFARTGALEELRKTLTADYSAEYAGECFYAGGYSYRYKFTAYPPKAAAGRPAYEWDFGDGQTSTSPTVQHLYLADGVYPVKLTVRLGGNADAQTTKLAVSRDYAGADKPPEDQPIMHAHILEGYDLNKVPPAWLPRAAWLFLRAEMLDQSLGVCRAVAALPKHADPAAAMEALREVTHEALLKDRPADALKVWQQVPPASDLGPPAAVGLAELLMWRAGDYPAAAKVLQPLAAAPGADVRTKRLYAQALLLSQKPADAKPLLQSLPNEGVPAAPTGKPDPLKLAAIGGASARTVEYYLTQKDWEAGEDAWDQWQARDPAGFLEGYSVLLKTRLLETAKSPESAARLAEAFARRSRARPTAPNCSTAPASSWPRPNPPAAGRCASSLKSATRKTRSPSNSIPLEPRAGGSLSRLRLHTAARARIAHESSGSRITPSASDARPSYHVVVAEVAGGEAAVGQGGPEGVGRPGR